MKISPLADINGYTELVSYYEHNKDKPWQEWIRFYRTFDKPGKQGLVGLLKTTDKNKDQKYVFKISQYINYLIFHESTIMQGLNQISPYCIHFCKSIGTITCNIEPKSRKSGNPFDIVSKYPIKKEVLLAEFIDNSYKMYNYIRATDKIHEDVLYSSIKQVLLAITIAQQEKKFTHYDLHSFNIMMKRCNKDVVFLYVLDKDKQHCVPTFGHYPVIIDFGFSYIEDMEDKPLWTSLAHTDVGFMSDRFDWVADPKLFLVTVSDEIKCKRKTKKAKRLRRLVANMFDKLSIEWDTGWDHMEDIGAADYVIQMLKGYNKDSKLFDECSHYCIDIMQSLIILPLEKQNYSNINESYCMFLKEWIKIENQISSFYYCIYILKGIVDIAREVRPEYRNRNTRDNAIKTFRIQLHDRINSVTSFCNPKNIHYEKMLCSILQLATNIEGVLYNVVNLTMKDKQKEYNKLPISSVEEVYKVIQANIPDVYLYNKNTTILVYDCISKTTNKIQLTEKQCNTINEIHPLYQGTTLYEIYNTPKTPKKCTPTYNIPDLTVGQQVLYIPTKETVNILNIHNEDPGGPYYTIIIDDTERQTTKDNLEIISM